VLKELGDSEPACQHYQRTHPQVWRALVELRSARSGADFFIGSGRDIA
jgi:hypothetical protein